MRKLPPLNALRVFEIAARHVSFTRAARELNVTHGAVSRQVAALESWLDTPLFVRSPSQLTLTEAGRHYLAEVTPALDRIAVATMSMLEQATPAALRVSAPPTFTMRWLLARMSGFQRKRPDAEIKLTTSIAPVEFQDRRYDVAIRGAHEPPPGCESVPFMTELVVPVCHVDLTESGRLTRPEDLRAQTLISYATASYTWNDWLHRAGAPEVRPAGTLHFEQMYFALQAAAEGLGLVLVPLFLVVDDIIAGELAAPFGALGAKRRRYYASYASASARNPVLQAFCDWLVREGKDTEHAMEAWAGSAGAAARL